MNDFDSKKMRAYTTANKRGVGEVAFPTIPSKITKEAVKDSYMNKDATVITQAQIPNRKRSQGAITGTFSKNDGVDSTFFLIPKKDKGVASVEDTDLFTLFW